MRILLLCTSLVLFLTYINGQEAAEAAAVEYDDVAAADEAVPVEEPVTTPKPRRSRLPATRTRSRGNAASAVTAAPEAEVNGNGGHAAETEAPAPPSSKAPAKRVRTTTTTTEAPEPVTKKTRAPSATTTTKSPSATEVVSTYKRPKFPPRKLTLPPTKTATLAPEEEFVDPEAPLDAGAEDTLDPLPADAPLEEELAAEEPLQ